MATLKQGNIALICPPKGYAYATPGLKRAKVPHSKTVAINLLNIECILPLLSAHIPYTLCSMHWFKEYPRSALLVLAIILILAGSLVVSRKSPVDTSLYSTGSGEGLSGASFSDYATQPDNIIIKPLPSSPIDTASNNPPFPYSSPFLSSDDNPILISE